MSGHADGQSAFEYMSEHLASVVYQNEIRSSAKADLTGLSAFTHILP